jgi:hypothetical protein
VIKLTLASALFLCFSTGCSLYKSEGRKNFESEAQGKIDAASTSSAFQLKGCKKEGKLETWFNEEFPASTYELVLSENDLEIWRTMKDKVVEVKALQKFETSTQSCTYEFANEIVWNLYKSDFIRELENNLMSAE